MTVDIIAPVKSTRSQNAFFTIPGLGDRIHLASILWWIHKEFNESVVLHLSSRQNDLNKRTSFDEILKIFPTNRIKIVRHPYLPTSNRDFNAFLKNQGVEASSFFYGDHPGWNELREGIDVSRYLDHLPLPSNLNVSSKSFLERYVTEQWDSSGSRRRLSTEEIDEIRGIYLGEGLRLETIGGEATNSCNRDSIEAVVDLMRNAEHHIGVDSGFMHLALLTLRPEQIHIYTKVRNYWSHHLFRWIDHGMRVNPNFRTINRRDFLIARLRYDSPTLLRLYHMVRR